MNRRFEIAPAPVPAFSSPRHGAGREEIGMGGNFPPEPEQWISADGVYAEAVQPTLLPT